MEPTPDPHKARHTDPETSNAGVERTRSLKTMVFIAAVELGGNFTDTMLKKQVKHSYYKDIDRGVIARTRLALERDGKLRRLASHDDDIELQFTLTLDGVMTSKGSGF